MAPTSGPTSHARSPTLTHILPVFPRLRTSSYVRPPVLSSPPMVGSETCACGRSFTHTFAFTNHQRTCQKSKKRLSDVLSRARVFWIAKKKPRLDVSRKTPEPPTSVGDGSIAEFNGAAEVLCSAHRIKMHWSHAVVAAIGSSRRR